MKKVSVLIALFLISSSLMAGTNPVAQQLLITAKQQASLFQQQVSPFQLDVAFQAQMNVPAKGHLTWKWDTKDRWWRSIVMGDFEQIEIRNGATLYVSRNVSFTPIPIRELISLLLFAEGSEKLVAKKERQRVENGISMTCLQIEQMNGRTNPHEVCLNAVSLEILSDMWQEPPDERRLQIYSDYFDFAGHRYPRKLQLKVNGSSVITADVQNLTAAPFDEKLLIPPKGAIERRQCDDMKHAVPIKTPDPIYPRSASQNRIMGDTTVAMTILTDGSVGDIQLNRQCSPLHGQRYFANVERLEIQTRYVRKRCSCVGHHGCCELQIAVKQDRWRYQGFYPLIPPFWTPSLTVPHICAVFADVGLLQSRHVPIRNIATP